MKTNAKIICRRNAGYGMVCEWKGPRNGVAKLYGEAIWDETAKPSNKISINRGAIFEVGRLKLRVVQYPMFGANGAGSDSAAVMLESPHAQLYQLYREKAEALVRLVMRVEAAYNAFRFNCKHGEVMPLTSKVADLLL